MYTFNIDNAVGATVGSGIADVDRRTIYYWRDAGILDGGYRRIAGRLLFDRDALAAAAARRKAAR